jgi:hypothetical protein
MRILQLIIRVAVLILLILGGISIWEGIKSGGSLLDWLSGKKKEETTHAMVVQEITSMGKLELTKYSFKDIVEHQIVKQWLPNSKAVLIVQGEAIGCIDLTQVDIADVVTQTDTLVVHLPDPELCVFKIDHSKSKVYHTEYAFLEEARLVEEAYKRAEAKIKQSALDMGILDQTRENARKVLTPMLEKASGRKVIIKFPMQTKLQKLQ